MKTFTKYQLEHPLGVLPWALCIQANRYKKTWKGVRSWYHSASSAYVFKVDHSPDAAQEYELLKFRVEKYGGKLVEIR